MRNPEIGHAKLSEIVGFIIIMTAGVIFLFFGALSAAGPFQAQQSYASTVGTTEEASITAVSGDRVGNTGFLDDKDYEVTITYKYEIDGTTYRSSKVFADDKRPNIVDNEKRAETLVQRYGTEPTVRYNPDDPSQSFLSANPFSLVTVILIGFGILTMIQGIYQMYETITTPKSER